MIPSLNERIKKIRGLKGFAQRYVAIKMGIDQAKISYLETKQKNIPDDILAKLADIYGVSVDFILHFNPQNILPNNDCAVTDSKKSNDQPALELVALMNKILESVQKIEERMDIVSPLIKPGK